MNSSMTEDDTFERLRRPTIHEMVAMYHQWMFDNYPGTKDTRKNIVFAKTHNWDWLEYLIAKKEAGYKP